MRGYLRRKFVRIWHTNRTLRVTKIQAAFRGHVLRRVFQTWCQWEHFNVIKIQAIVRGFFARRLARSRRRTMACVHIQMLWRGHRDRRRADLLRPRRRRSP